MENVFEFDFKKGSHADSNYSILGKALFVAVRFEKSFKNLVLILGIRYDPKVLDENLRLTEFKEKVKKRKLFHDISDLKGRLKKASSKLDLEGTEDIFLEQFEKIVTVARESRNYIAHEFAIDFEQAVGAVGSEKDTIEILKKHLKNILEGQIVILLITTGFMKEQSPLSESIEKRKAEIIDWVIS